MTLFKLTHSNNSCGETFNYKNTSVNSKHLSHLFLRGEISIIKLLNQNNYYRHNQY